MSYDLGRDIRMVEIYNGYIKQISNQSVLID